MQPSIIVRKAFIVQEEKASDKDASKETDYQVEPGMMAEQHRSSIILDGA